MTDSITTLELDKKKIALQSKLNPKQILFCEYYATDREFFGNGTDSYMEAYDTNNYKAAMSCAYDLLRKTEILEYINYLFETRGLNDAFVDKQLELVITQNSDFRSKISAIGEYNKLKKRTASVVNPTQINVFVSDAIAKKNGIVATIEAKEINKEFEE